MKKNLNGLYHWDHWDHFDRLDGGRRRLLALAAAGPLLGWSAGAGAQAGAPPPGIIKLLVGYSAGGPGGGARGGHHQARRRLQRGRPGGRLCAAAGADPGGRTRHPGHRREPARRERLARGRRGGGGEGVAKAPPDGAMIYFGASPTITINPNIQRKMSFDPGKDLLPIA